VMPPISLSTTFAQHSPGKPLGHFEYSRSNNPTREILEATLATLENGKYGLCFSSGCAAMAALLQTLPLDSHVILSDDIYGGSLRLLKNIFGDRGIQYNVCDLTDPAQLKSFAQENTRLIWIETPSNPLLKIIDIKAIHEARKKVCPNAILAIDNTFATPYLQTPLSLGADLVCHSSSKYLGGHSDVIGGALILNDDELHEKLKFTQNAIGAVPSPFDCYLFFRSIKTLAVRMKAHCDNARKIAAHFESHARVKSVIYPGLTSHPQHTLAKTQMLDFGGMISMRLDLSLPDVTKFLSALKIFTLAESLGGVESLIEHPATMTHAAIPEKHRQKIGIDDGLVRISVGIEDPEDLIADLEQALSF
jgi:cystathionine beta-lyase/cystathionine gamma-synthase